MAVLPLLIQEHDFGLGKEGFLQRLLRIGREIDGIGGLHLLENRNPFRQMDGRIEIVGWIRPFKNGSKSLLFSIES